jgi:pectate lyase
VTVTSASQLTDYAGRSGSYVIRVNGTISLSSMTKVTSNKTIIGVGTAGRITGYGLNVNQANNVVIRNLTFTDGTVQRNPRVRFGTPVHVLNNYYDGNSGYGVASTCNAGVLVEKNYFQDVEHPTVVQTGDSPEGNLRLADNYLTGSGTAESRNASSVPNVPYSYSADAASNVKSIVTAGAGVGKI